MTGVATGSILITPAPTLQPTGCIFITPKHSPPISMDGEPKSYKLTDKELCQLDSAEWDREWAAHQAFYKKRMATLPDLDIHVDMVEGYLVRTHNKLRIAQLERQLATFERRLAATGILMF